MGILIVDDSQSSRVLLKTVLKKAGFEDVVMAESAEQAFEALGMNNADGPAEGVDLILMDIIMPGIDGIESTRRIKASEAHRDIPVVMVTAMEESESIQAAFDAGAIDYITKPINKVELKARVRSALQLKYEMDQRKAREKELLEVTRELQKANKILERLAIIDGLTGIANRRHFDEHLEMELRRARRDATELSLLLIDIDYFKLFNDTYGHQMGDDCLKKVAGALNDVMKRPGDFVARYGGEEFVIVLADTSSEHALMQAEKARNAIERMNVPHEASKVVDHVTVSLGVATAPPDGELSPQQLVEAADKGLYRAKEEGRNRAVVSEIGG